MHIHCPALPCLPLASCRCPKGLVMQNVTGPRAGVCHSSCYKASHFVPLIGRKVCKNCHFSCASCHPKANELHCKSCPSATTLYRNMDNVTLTASVAAGLLPSDGGKCISLTSCPLSLSAALQGDGSYVCLPPTVTPAPTPSRSITPASESPSPSSCIFPA